MAEEELAELLVRYNSGMYKAGVPRDDAPPAVPSDATNDGWYGPEGRKIRNHITHNELRVALEEYPVLRPWELWFA